MYILHIHTNKILHQQLKTDMAELEFDRVYVHDRDEKRKLEDIGTRTMK